MDGRWLLLSVLLAAVAAVRLRRRTPSAPPPEQGRRAAPPSGTTGSPDPVTPSQTWTDAQIDAHLDAHLDAPLARPDTARGSESGSAQDDGIADALDRVWAEHAGEADTLLDARLRLIVRRGVPARAIRPAPGARTVRVVFADGTVLLCRGSGQGDFGRLGLALLHHSVCLGSFARDANGTRLEFRWHPDQRLAAVAVGLDQPD